MRGRHGAGMAWQADNPQRGMDAEVNRRFWHWMAWEVRFWLTLVGLVMLIGVAFVVWAIARKL